MRPFQASSKWDFPRDFHGISMVIFPTIFHRFKSSHWKLLNPRHQLLTPEVTVTCQLSPGLTIFWGGHHGWKANGWNGMNRGWKNIWFQWRMMIMIRGILSMIEHMMHIRWCVGDIMIQSHHDKCRPVVQAEMVDLSRTFQRRRENHDGCHGLATFKASKLPPTHRLHRCTAGTAGMNFNPRSAGLALKYEEIWHSKPLTVLDSFTKPLTSAGVNAARDGILKHLRTWFCQSFTLLMIQRVLPPPFLWRTQQNSTPACVWCVLPHLAVGPAFKTSCKPCRASAMQALSSKTIFVSNAARFVGRNRWVQRDNKPGTKCSNKNKILVVSINGRSPKRMVLNGKSF